MSLPSDHKDNLNREAVKLNFTEIKLNKLSQLIDSGVLKILTHIRTNLAARLTNEEINYFTNAYTEINQQKLEILSPLDTSSSNLTSETNPEKTINPQPVGNIYYKKAWSIWDKVYFFIVQADGSLSVADLQEKILDHEGIPSDSEEARRISVNLNATLSAKFKSGNDLIDRRKEKGEYRYFLVA